MDLRALLNVAAEFQREARGLFVELLQVVARGLIFVHTGEAVAEQGALNKMFRG